MSDMRGGSHLEGWWGGIDEISDILEESLFGDMAGVETVDGCIVEPDGSCPHGFYSPLVEAGLI